MFYSNRGIHWSNAENPRLRILAQDQAWHYADPWVEDEDDLPREVEVVFISQGASLTLRCIDQEAISLFRYGHCAFLAWAIHQKTQLPLVLFTNPSDEGGWSGHAAVQVGEDAYLDIAGIHTAAHIKQDYPKTGAPEVVDEDQFLERTVDKEYRSDPLGILCELEQLVLDDFADYVLSYYQVGER